MIINGVCAPGTPPSASAQLFRGSPCLLRMVTARSSAPLCSCPGLSGVGLLETELLSSKCGPSSRCGERGWALAGAGAGAQHGDGAAPAALGSHGPCPASATLALAQGSVFHNCQPALPERCELISDGTQSCPGPALVDLKDLVPSPQGFCHRWAVARAGGRRSWDVSEQRHLCPFVLLDFLSEELGSLFVPGLVSNNGQPVSF